MTAPRLLPTESRQRGLPAARGSIMIALRLTGVFLVALLLQLTFFVEVRVAGVAPELPALVAILAGLLAGVNRGAQIAFVAGLMWDIYLSTPLGLAAASFALVAYGLGSITEGLFHDTRTQMVILVFVGTAAAVTVYALLGDVLGQSGLVDDDLAWIVLVASLLNALISLAAAPAMRWALASSGSRAGRHGVPRQP